MLTFLFRAHARLILHAAILFAVGLFVAAPVVRYGVTAVAWPALAVLRALFRVLGPAPGIARTAAVIFGFNSSAIFLYMASGFHPIAPKLFAVWTGMNIGIIVGMARQGAVDVPCCEPRPDQWRPSLGQAAACGALVLVLELTCFWTAIAMGMSMGKRVLAGERYLAALAPRARAYFSVLVPLLFVSALAESVALRGTPGEDPSAAPPWESGRAADEGDRGHGNEP